MHRMRVMLEGARTFVLKGNVAIIPSLEVGTLASVGGSVVLMASSALFPGRARLVTPHRVR